jgi:GAF domain-containing protein
MSFVAGLRHALELRQRDVASELDRGDSLEDVLNRHLLTVEEMCDDEILTSVLLLSPDGKRLTHGAAPSLPQVYREAIDGSEIGPSAGSCGTAAYSGAPVYVTDIATDPRWAAYKDYALPHGLRSCWSTPIRHADGHVMGTFAIYHRTSCGPVRAELDAIQVIADNVAQAITWARDPDGRMHSFTMLPKQVAALEAIAAAISSHASALDPEGQEAIDAIVQGSRKLAEVLERQLANAN